MRNYIGTAAWNIPSVAAEAFPEEGSHLERYAKVFNAVEINSSFYKDHRRETFERWASSVPEDFRFSAKLSKRFTHEKSASFSATDLRESLDAIAGLGVKWRVLLLQYPGSLDCPVVKLEKLLDEVRRVFNEAIVIEARNTSWVADPVLKLMERYRVGLVSADPERCPYDGVLGEIDYERLHGSPDIYKSSYPDEVLDALAETWSAREHWIIFDNTTFGQATLNALGLKKRSGFDAKDFT